MKTLSIITTFRNEQSVLPEFIRRVKATGQRCIDLRYCTQFEIVLVNDDSTDRSLEILKDLSKKTPHIKVVTTSRVFGVDECFVLALKYASGDLIACLESDLQDPPELIPKLLARLVGSNDLDVVHAVKERRLGESWLRQAVTKIGYELLYGTSYLDLPRQASNFKVFTKRVAQHVNGLEESKPFFRGMIAWAGFKHDSYPFERHARYSGQSKFPIFGKRVIGNFLNAALISFSSAPLKVPLIAGASLALLSALAIVIGIVAWATGHVPPSAATLGVLMVGLSSLQFLFIGILGLYVNTIFLQSKNRPVCVVKSVDASPAEMKGQAIRSNTHREYILEK